MTVTEKREYPNFQEWPHTSSEVTLILENAKHRCRTPVEVGPHGDPVVDDGLTQFWVTVDPSVCGPHPIPEFEQIYLATGSVIHGLRSLWQEKLSENSRNSSLYQDNKPEAKLQAWEL